MTGKDSQTVREETARRLRHKQPYPKKERVPEPQVCSSAQSARSAFRDTQRAETHVELLLLLSFSIYEKLIQFCSIDELGTNYPKDMFDPHGWSEDSYYEALGGRSHLVLSKLVVLNWWSLRIQSFLYLELATQIYFTKTNTRAYSLSGLLNQLLKFFN